MKLKVPVFLVLIFALALTAGVSALTPLGDQSTASADDNCGCDVTFTKWVTVFPNMSGTIGGDVTGSFQGLIVNSPDLTKATTVIEAFYSFNARGTHSFTARVQVTQDNQKGAATITGTVVDGWLKGGSVTGQYKVVTSCAQAAPEKAPDDLCFQGSLHLTPAR